MLSIVLALVAAILLSLALVLSHDSPCGTASATPTDAQAMKAVVRRCYGSSEVVTLEDVAKPTLGDNSVLIKVHAASVNPLDWHTVRGNPYIMRMSMGLGAPADIRLGVDFAGTIVAVGKNVTRFKPGDDVFGGRDGAFAEYVTVREVGALALKPANVTFEQAAAAPVAALTALQALRDKGKIRPGQKVLINGASGGVGTYAVQIARSYGAEVTGVTSTRNVDLVRSIGANHVIDYTVEDFTKGAERYDVMLDLVGNRSLSASRSVLTPNGMYIGIGGGGPSDGGFIGPLSGMAKLFVMSPFVSQKLEFFVANLNKEDLTILGDLMQAGKVTTVIDKSYRLSETPAAVRYLEQGHARGKVVITME